MNRSKAGKAQSGRPKSPPSGSKGAPGPRGYQRVPGPGPKDAGKGAAGPEAQDRLDRNH